MTRIYGKSIDFLTSRENFFKHKERFYLFQNVKLKTTKGLSLFFDSNDQIIEHTLDEHIYWQPLAMGRAPMPYHPTEVQARKQFLKDSFASFKPKCFFEIDNTIDLTHSLGWYPFGHLFDSLQRLFSIRSFLHDTSYRLIVSKHEHVVNFFDYLSVLCRRSFDKESVTQATPNTVLRIKNLVFSNPRSAPSYMERESLEWLRKSFWDFYKIDPRPQFNLYLDRNGARGDSRNVINNQEVLDFLRNRGFIVLNGSENLEDTLFCFSNARIIMGAHGSLFSNAIFCNSKTHIFEFCPRNRAIKCFQECLKLTPHYSFIELDSDDKFNITIDTSYLKRLLDTAEGL